MICDWVSYCQLNILTQLKVTHTISSVCQVWEVHWSWIQDVFSIYQWVSFRCTVMALLKSHVTHTGTCSWRVGLLLHQSPKFFVQQWIFARCVQVPSKFLNHAIGHFLFLARWRKHLHLSSYLNSFPNIVLTFSE